MNISKLILIVIASVLLAIVIKNMFLSVIPNKEGTFFLWFFLYISLYSYLSRLVTFKEKSKKE